MRGLALSCSLFLALAASGCNILWNVAKKKAEQKVSEASPGGTITPPVVVADSISINSVLPNRGAVAGGLAVEIVGLGFTSSVEVFDRLTVYFGDTPAADLATTVSSDDHLQTTTPPGTLGVVDVTVVVEGRHAGDPAGTPTMKAKGKLANGFEYYEPVTLTSLSPGRGPTSGGTSVILTGTGFVDGTKVRFGDGTLLTATLIGSTSVQVTTPRLPHAIYDVTVANGNGAATLAAAFSVYEVVRVRSVAPFAGPLTGGTPVTVAGTGFISPCTLTFGSQTLVNAASADETTLQATTLAAAPPVEGPVDVTVTNDSGSGTLRDAFVFVDDTNPSPRVTAVTPKVGLIAGGNTVHIAGKGFADGPVSVTFSAEPATCEVVSDSMLDCVAPPHAEGTVNIHVVNVGLDALAVNAYTYIELRIDALVPNRGAVAGGTYVIVYGNGFGGETDVALGGLPATDIAVLDQGRVALRTPPGALGLADLALVRDGLEVDLGGAFTYFDPINTTDWSSGGPIDGSVNVTVIDDHGRLEGAFVMLGVDPTTRYQGFTNPRGQITFSGPDIVGHQTVTAAKAEHTNMSWVDVDAQNLLLRTPSYPVPRSGAPSCGPHSPVVAGTVHRIKDEYNTGTDIVVVTTTYQSFSGSLPDPGPNAQLVSQGPYELWTRTGSMVVLALAGVDDGTHHLKVDDMGFHPFMLTEASSETICTSDSDCPSGEVCYSFGTKYTCGRSVTCRNDNDCADGESCVQQGQVSICARTSACCVVNDNCNADNGESCIVQQPDQVCTKRYDNVDITIDTPLKQQMRVDLDAPPLALAPTDAQYGFAPDTTTAQVWYDFGSMGLHSMDSVTVPGADVVYVPMPEALPGALAGTEFKMIVGTYLAGSSSHSAESEVYLENLVDTTQPINATPFLGTQREVAPAYQAPIGSPLHFEFSVNKDVLPSANLHYLLSMTTGMEVWIVYSPPSTHLFELPVFPDTVADLRLAPGTSATDPASYLWYLYALYSPGALFNRLDPSVLQNWRSFAIYTSQFTVPAPP